MAAVTRLGASGLARHPYGSFAGKALASTKPVDHVTRLGAMGVARHRYGDFSGKVAGVPVVPDAVDRSPDAYFKPEHYLRAKKRYYAQLQEELDRQLEAQERAAQPVQEPKKRKGKKTTVETPKIIINAPLMAEASQMQRQVAEMLASQPKTDTTQRVRYEALLAELDRMAQDMAMQDEEDAVFMLAMI